MARQKKFSSRVKGTIIICCVVVLTNLMMDGSGNGGLSYTNILSTKEEHTDRATS